jgi:hypothetical protein
VVTVLALAIAKFAKPLDRRVSADFELGTLFMYVFFACLGAGANLPRRQGLPCSGCEARASSHDTTNTQGALACLTSAGSN